MAVDFSARTGETLEFLDGVETVQVNLGNGETLLTMLGLCDPASPEGPWVGQCHATEFVARATLAEMADPGTPTPGFDDGRWHQVGSDADHIAMRLAELAELARIAAEAVPAGVITWS
jgi:hypothetical protein